MMISGDEIQKWLSDEGLFRQKIVDEGVIFHFGIETAPQNLLEVIQPKGKDDLVVIASKVTVSPEHLNKLTALNRKKRENFLWNFKLALNQMSIDFMLIHPDNVLREFTITHTIYQDSMTKDRLIETIKRVSRAKLQGIWLIQQEFGSAISEKTDSVDESRSYG
jgi:hypothetical protein